MYKQHRWRFVYLCKIWHDTKHCRKKNLSIVFKEKIFEACAAQIIIEKFFDYSSVHT